ncbi:MAG TPA: alpha/beta fold hydrolase, partial [Thermoanaerobaculia bacterium]|nr:alpha/beta fold hydrolase [Thermoanaerobaculia bacterium]
MRIEWNGASAEIRELGSGPSIILVHGYPLDGAMWSGVARALAARFRVFKPDLPGRGNTEAAAPSSIAGYADFVETLVREVPPPVGLAGFSFGGYISLDL